ncbi:nucleotidyltransferase family protein [Floccifex sp.]|uniref:nucleotidyltransferase family protein n=1 Tax=Floccifex sp. TaxID=2815810 RepID=UPI002A753B5B|nr:nucleotidyltransferase family protein [Floccifex sp.]MDD7280917.1 nucleotidyltransferase family protein [Erysipelotrichaceae bacterium]MDY2957990.1 nucleotidyltransferase family protein [Floccifex sp.]
MKSCGIIAEYNPFHKGHEYHLQQARLKTNCDCLIVIVSSYFSQRGLPSYLTRSDKTKLSLEHGANIVLELPACFSCQSADYFAKYAIQSLSTLDIDYLCFGSETNDINYLRSLSFLNEIDASKNINQNQNISLQPNDILGYQYIKYCDKYDIEPVSIQRNNNFKSATQTRKDAFHFEQDYQSYFHLEQNWNSYYPYLRLFLQLTDASTLASFFLVNEGIEYRLKSASKQCETWDNFLNQCISKTYTKARIQRTCMMILLQIKKDEMMDSFFGCRVLGFDSIGQQYLKEHKNNRIYTKFKDLPSFLQEVELKSQALYQNFTSIDDNKVIRYDSID